jgi:hypothetical protein
MATRRPATSASGGRATQGGYGGTPAFAQDVELYDAPIAGFSSVNIALTEVDAIAAEGTVSVLQKYAAPTVVDLLAYQSSALPIGGTIAAGSYAGIQLVGSIGKSSAVTSAGTTMSISVAGATGDTFTLPIGVAFGSSDGTAASVAVDFNLAESLVLSTVGSAGGTTLQLAPVAVANPDAGNVAGVALDAANQPAANATIAAVDSNGNVVNTTLTAADGSFNLHALPLGAYRLEIFNAYRNAAGSVFTASNFDGPYGASYFGPDVAVTSGTTNVGTVRD